MRQSGPIPEQCPPNLWCRPDNRSELAEMKRRSTEREIFAMKWRAVGYTFRQIGDAMDVTMERARAIFLRGKRRAKKD